MGIPGAPAPGFGPGGAGCPAAPDPPAEEPPAEEEGGGDGGGWPKASFPWGTIEFEARANATAHATGVSSHLGDTECPRFAGIEPVSLSFGRANRRPMSHARSVPRIRATATPPRPDRLSTDKPYPTAIQYGKLLARIPSRLLPRRAEIRLFRFAGAGRPFQAVQRLSRKTAWKGRPTENTGTFLMLSGGDGTGPAWTVRGRPTHAHGPGCPGEACLGGRDGERFVNWGRRFDFKHVQHEEID